MTKYKYSDSDFIAAVNASFSVRDTLKTLGVAPHGGSYKTFHLRIKKLNIDISHFTGQGHLKNKTHTWSEKIKLEDLLIANSDKVFSVKYKERIIKEGLLENKCSKCGLQDTWQGEPIVLHLDHINGNHFNHRIENLRLLCPNCHSQTPTYCSKNKGINPPKIRKSDFVPQEQKKCRMCDGVLRDSRYDFCKKCYDSNRKLLQTPYERTTKIVWPPVDELKLRLETTSYLALSRELGVSDSAIRKHIKNNK